MDEQNRYQTRTGHFILFWNVPREIYRQEHNAEPTIAILEFSPRANRQTWRYATNGMSEYTQAYGVERVQTELFVSANEQCAWAIPLLEGLARYPKMHGTYLGEYDTISVGKAIDRKISPFTAILLAPPGAEEDVALGAIRMAVPDLVLVHQVIGVYESECAFAVNHGGDKLYDRLRRDNVSLSIDDVRHPVALRLVK